MYKQSAEDLTRHQRINPLLHTVQMQTQWRAAAEACTLHMTLQWMQVLSPITLWLNY